MNWNEIKNLFKAVEDFLNEYVLNWKCTSTKYLQTINSAEIIFGTIKDDKRKVTYIESVDSAAVIVTQHQRGVQ